MSSQTLSYLVIGSAVLGLLVDQRVIVTIRTQQRDPAAVGRMGPGPV